MPNNKFKNYDSEEEFLKSEEWIKAYYWFDAMWKFRFAKNCIRKGLYRGWEELHDFFNYRKAFHDKLNSLKQITNQNEI